MHVFKSHQMFHSGRLMRQTMNALEVLLFTVDRLGLYGARNVVLILQRNIYMLFQVIYALLFIVDPTDEQRRELELAPSSSALAPSENGYYGGYYGDHNRYGPNSRHSYGYDSIPPTTYDSVYGSNYGNTGGNYNW